ncbi:MAG: hypothetical protein U5N58_07180 [Actinomycetota bacterium]|nr:hypothetical protein [Actinomycetota bacterium]
MNKFKDREKASEEELEMGLDAVVTCPHLAGTLSIQTLSTGQWTRDKGWKIKYLYRRIWELPKGAIDPGGYTEKVTRPKDRFFPYFDDYIIPRSEKFFVDPEKISDKLKYLLGPFSKENIRKLKDQAD